MILKRRVLIVAAIVMLLLAGLLYRLADIQMIHTESFSSKKVNLIEESVRQRTQVMILDQGRGRFVDRHGEALTHDYFPSLILFPFLKYIDWPIEEVASILKINENVLVETVNSISEPVAFGNPKPMPLTEQQMTMINELKIPGVFAVYRQSRVEDLVAEHLIGIVRENKDEVLKRYPEKVKEENLSVHTPVGILGLQKVFDEFLLPEGESKLLYHVDNRGGPLFGIDVKYTAPANPYYPISVQTTIDKRMQEAFESIATKKGLTRGGVIVLDIDTNEVLAMVSKPTLNQVDPYSNLGAYNYLLETQIPGSVFKTVIAAAAIEQNIIESERLFDCDLNLYGEKDEKHQLGKLTFEDSFAQSCNYTFSTLANELMKENPTIIEEYASKLGLVQPVGWVGDVFHFQQFEQLPVNKKGQIWKESYDKSAPKAIAQTAIGQKEVRVTPLAVANMMATIARGGEKEQVRVVSKILYKNGTTLFNFPNQSLDGDTVAPYTAMKLQQLLRKVVEDDKGTGRRFQALETEVSGKSGTAETGRVDTNGRPLVNKWFAGYFPSSKPKYAMVVVELEVLEFNTVANDVYYELVKEMTRLN
ncbi:peptidoglycan D,D-transpeptidase FtsI family protein [Bacillus salitolerans]|uniref:serine-type D-Ala-D-Ala carboxypeptidase n=1 Tax=Bacillus salitolerans TaxID=1437434 RepID=A0ABW4LQ89_9BACI